MRPCALADVPVRCVPPFVADLPSEALDRAELGLDPESVMLLAVCNLADGVGMTNPDGALEVLRCLHHEAPGRFEMILLVEHAGADIRAAAQLRECARELPVVVIDDPIADAHRRGLLAACDVVLSLHRAGAFNPRIAEAMLMKRPIVATGYGGITDLLNETTGYPVPWRKTRLQRAVGPSRPAPSGPSPIRKLPPPLCCRSPGTPRAPAPAPPRRAAMPLPATAWMRCRDSSTRSSSD